MRRRLTRLALLSAGLLAGWVASAAGGLIPPVPPVPSVKLPTLPLLPPPPRPPQVPPVSAPRVPAVPPVSHPALPVGGGGGAAHTGSQSSSGAARDGSSSSGPARVKVYRLHFYRDWITRTGPKSRRQTVLAFFLRRSALVEFVVVQIAPGCRQIGRFRVQGHPGLNRVRVRGRIGRRVLGPGTYRIRARTPRGSRIVDTQLVVVGSANRGEIASARRANACAAPADHSASRDSTTRAGAIPSRHSPKGTPTANGTSGTTATTSSPSRSHGVLGARFTKAIDAVKSISPYLFAVLALAILLLALASLPLRVTPNGRTAAVLAHHRGMIALAGATALAAVMVAFALR